MIIFFYGEDQFRSHQKILEIKNKYLASDKSGSGLSFCDCEEEKKILEKIKNSLETANLFSSKRLLIVRNVITGTSDIDQKNVLEYLKKNIKSIEKDNETVAVFWETSAPKKNNALFRFLDKNSKKQNFEKLSGLKLSQWTLKALKEINPEAKISKTALEKIASYTGGDTRLIFSELQKLASYASGRMISGEDVEKMVRANIAGNIFATIDALGANNKKEALRLLHNHMEQGDDPFYLFSMVIYQIRNLLKVADMSERERMPEYEISKTTKMHPFVVKKSLSQIRYFPLAKLKKMYAALLDIDVKVKTGGLDMKTGLDKFVAEL